MVEALLHCGRDPVLVTRARARQHERVAEIDDLGHGRGIGHAPIVTGVAFRSGRVFGGSADARVRSTRRDRVVRHPHRAAPAHAAPRVLPGPPPRRVRRAGRHSRRGARRSGRDRNRVHRASQPAHRGAPRHGRAAARHGPRRHRGRGDLPRQPELRAHPVPPAAARQRRELHFDRELATVGVRIYNDWLADFCSVEPARHVGLAHLPMWDPVAATAELPRVADAGLRGVNFPALRHGVYLEYNDRAWDPFWAECEARRLTLCTHVGAASPGKASGPGVARAHVDRRRRLLRPPRDLVDDLRRGLRALPRARAR